MPKVALNYFIQTIMISINGKATSTVPEGIREEVCESVHAADLSGAQHAPVALLGLMDLPSEMTCNIASQLEDWKCQLRMSSANRRLHKDLLPEREQILSAVRLRRSLRTIDGKFPSGRLGSSHGYPEFFREHLNRIFNLNTRYRAEPLVDLIRLAGLRDDRTQKFLSKDIFNILFKLAKALPQEGRAQVLTELAATLESLTLRNEIEAFSSIAEQISKLPEDLRAQCLTELATRSRGLPRGVVEEITQMTANLPPSRQREVASAFERAPRARLDYQIEKHLAMIVAMSDHQRRQCLMTLVKTNGLDLASAKVLLKILEAMVSLPPELRAEPLSILTRRYCDSDNFDRFMTVIAEMPREHRLKPLQALVLQREKVFAKAQAPRALRCMMAEIRGVAANQRDSMLDELRRRFNQMWDEAKASSDDAAGYAELREMSTWFEWQPPRHRLASFEDVLKTIGLKAIEDKVHALRAVVPEIGYLASEHRRNAFRAVLQEIRALPVEHQVDPLTALIEELGAMQRVPGTRGLASNMLHSVGHWLSSNRGDSRRDLRQAIASGPEADRTMAFNEILNAFDGLPDRTRAEMLARLAGTIPLLRREDLGNAYSSVNEKIFGLPLQYREKPHRSMIGLKDN